MTQRDARWPLLRFRLLLACHVPPVLEPPWQELLRPIEPIAVVFDIGYELKLERGGQWEGF